VNGAAEAAARSMGKLPGTGPLSMLEISMPPIMPPKRRPVLGTE
jgi:hypothetical protein